MFKKTANLSNTVETEQLKLLSELEGLDPHSKEYNETLEHITKLETVKIKKTRISKDAVVGAVASLAGIILVINYERVGAITSKGFGLIRKP